MQAVDLDAIGAQIQQWCQSRAQPDAPYGSYTFTGRDDATFYASADTAILRWIVGEDVQQTVSAADRQAWSDVLNAFQQPGDGRYGPEMAHHVLHANGTAVNALAVIGGRHRHPVRFYDLFNTPERIGPWLSQIRWDNPWPASHVVWGGPVVWARSSRCSTEWFDACLSWLTEQADPATGSWPKDLAGGNGSTIAPLGCAVHLWPLYRHAGLPVPGLSTLAQHVVQWQREDGSWDGVFGYGTMDAMYVLAVAIEAGAGDTGRYRDAMDTYRSRHLEQDPTTWSEELTTHQALCWASSVGYLQRGLPDRFTSSVSWGDIFDRPDIYDLDRVTAD